MQTIRIPFTNFQYGEISPSLIGRTDIAVYTNSAQRIKNFYIRAEGGVIKRSGMKHNYEFTQTVTPTTFTITVSDYANIAVGTTIVLHTSDGTKISLVSEAVGSGSPTATANNIHYFKPNTSNNVTADNIFTALNAVDGLTVTNPSAAVVTVQRTDPNGTSNLSVSTTDSTRLAVTNFTGGADQEIRILPFIFSDDERYVIALSAGKVEVFILDFLANGTASSGAVTHIQSLTADVDGTSLSTAFTIAKLKEITYAQSGDVLFLCHTTFMPYKLVRSSLLTFELSPYSFDQRADSKQIYQPYYSFQGPSITMTPQASSGSGKTFIIRPSGTLANWAASTSYAIGALVTDTNAKQVYRCNTAHTSSGSEPISTNTHVANWTAFNYYDLTGSADGSGNYTSSKHINTTFRYRGQEIIITSVQSGSQATGTIADTLFVKLGVNAFRTINGSTSVEVTMPLHNLSVSDAITIAEADAVGNISTGNLNGSRTVATIVDDNRFTFAAGGSANASVDGGGAPKITCNAESADFEEQSYSDVRGFPAAVCFHEGRLWFGGTLSQPDGLWSSQSGEFFNFNAGTALDNQSIQLTSSVGQLDSIKHLVSNRDLQVFTESSEFIVPSFENTPITPTNAMIRRQTPYGASSVRPYVFDGATIYVQRSGTVVREFIFSDQEAAYIANAVSSISSHLITSPVQMTTLQAAIERPESYIFLLNSDGTMAVFNSNRAEKRAGWTQFAPTNKGQFHSVCTVDERVFVVGKFNKGSATQKYVLMELDNDLNLDMAKTYSGTAGVFTVGSEFATGAELDVVSGSDYLGKFTVASNEIDVSAVDSSLTSAEIGFGFDINLKTNPLDIVTSNGPTTGMLRGLGRVILDLNNTLSVSINSKKLEIRNVTDDFSIPRIAITGKKEFRLLGYSRDPQIEITQSAPLSAQINSIIAEVQI